MNLAVSVVVAAFNGERFIEQTLASIVAQSRPALEVIVVDDGSRDETVRLVERTIERSGPLVRLVEQPNQGVSAARNKGLALARGTAIAFLDQDDVWEPQLLERQLARLESDASLVVVYADSRVIDMTDSPHGTRSEYLGFAEGDVLQPLVHGNFVPLETAVIRADALHALGGFRQDLKFMEDYDLFLRLARRGRFGLESTPLARYRIHDRNLSHHRAGLLQEWVLLLDELAEDATLAPGVRAQLEAERGRRRGELAWQYLREARPADARAALRGGLRVRPLSLAAKDRIGLALFACLPLAIARRMTRLLPPQRLYGLRRLRSEDRRIR